MDNDGDGVISYDEWFLGMKKLALCKTGITPACLTVKDAIHKIQLDMTAVLEGNSFALANVLYFGVLLYVTVVYKRITE